VGGGRDWGRLPVGRGDGSGGGNPAGCDAIAVHIASIAKEVVTLPKGIPSAIGCRYPTGNANCFGVVAIGGLGRELPSLSAVLDGAAGDRESHESWVVTDVSITPAQPCCDLPCAGLMGGTLQSLDAVDRHQLLDPFGIQAGVKPICAAGILIQRIHVIRARLLLLDVHRCSSISFAIRLGGVSKMSLCSTIEWPATTGSSQSNPAHRWMSRGSDVAAPHGPTRKH